MAESALRLKVDERTEIMRWFAEGRTIRYIRKKLTQRANKHSRADMVPTDQDLLAFATQYGDDIDEYREQLAADTLKRGYARKEHRVRKLSEMAESLEEQAMTGMNLRASDQYRKTLGSIQNEVEGLNITIIRPDDKWAQLLKDLREKRPSSSQETSTRQPSNMKEDQVQVKLTPLSSISFEEAESLPTQNNDESSTSNDD